MCWGIGVKRRASGYGKPFQKTIARDIASQTSGWHTLRSFLRSTTPLWEKRPERLPMSNVGITRLSQRLARFVRMTLSFSKSVVMLRPHVCSSFFTVTIERALLLKRGTTKASAGTSREPARLHFGSRRAPCHHQTMYSQVLYLALQILKNVEYHINLFESIVEMWRDAHNTGTCHYIYLLCR